MNAVVYAATKEVREELLSTRNVKETVVADNVVLVEYLRDNSFKLFLAQVDNISELSLKTLGHIYRVLVNEG